MNLNLPKDMLYLLALDLDMATLAAYCRSNKRFNNIACDNEVFWINKLKKDFQIEYNRNRESAKHVYRTIYEALNEVFDASYSYLPVNVTKLINKEDLRKEFIKDNIENIIKPFYDSVYVEPSKQKVFRYKLNSALNSTWPNYFNPHINIWDNELAMEQDDIEQFKDFILGPNSFWREWSMSLISELEPNEYLDINAGKIVNLENRHERPINEIWIPSLKVVGTEEDILRYFLKLGTNENQLRPHLAAKLP